jgi:hypothetical protein
MAKSADAADLKSAGRKRLWEFKSPSGHHIFDNLALISFSYCCSLSPLVHVQVHVGSLSMRQRFDRRRIAYASVTGGSNERPTALCCCKAQRVPDAVSYCVALAATSRLEWPPSPVPDQLCVLCCGTRQVAPRYSGRGTRRQHL